MKASTAKWLRRLELRIAACEGDTRAAGLMTEANQRKCWRCGSTDIDPSIILTSCPPQYICRKCNGKAETQQAQPTWRKAEGYRAIAHEALANLIEHHGWLDPMTDAQIEALITDIKALYSERHCPVKAEAQQAEPDDWRSDCCRAVVLDDGETCAHCLKACAPLSPETWAVIEELAQPAEPSAPAEYVYLPGEVCEVQRNGEWVLAQFIRPPESHANCGFGEYAHYYSLPDFKPVTLYTLGKHKLRPVAAAPGCAVRHVETGELGLVTPTGCVRDDASSLHFLDPAVWRVIALPGPAAEAQVTPQARALLEARNGS